MFIDDAELREIFKVAAEEHLQQIESNLLHLEKSPEDHAALESLLREAHSLKGDANMLGVKDVGRLSHQIEDVLGSVKRSETAFTSELDDRLYQALDAMRKLVHEAVTGEAVQVDVFHVMAYLMGATTPDLPEHPVVEPSSAQATAAQPTDEPPEAHREKSEPQNSEVLALAKDPALNGASPSESLIETSTKTVSPQILAPRSASIAEPQISTYRIDTIRVETQKLDALMTQVGELTVAKTRINRRLVEIDSLIDLWEDWSRDEFKNRLVLSESQFGSENGHLAQVQGYYRHNQTRIEQLGQLLHQLKNATYEDTTRLESVSTELEEDIRTLRLLPLSTVFQLFPRMVRDLARQEGKLVELVIEGGDTQADKRILEEMKDPLMHMIRNAIDHGIESPEERQRLGKPKTATIRLRGLQTATSIVIEVMDDGRGLDTEAIQRTAVERGICRQEDLAGMTDRQIQSLIFAPGFSTRNFITEVSGRGVGLDVVHTNVERLKGSIQIESTLGVGSTFRIHLRATLATAHVLIVEVEGIPYAIPLEFVQTSLFIRNSDVFTMGGRDTILIDEQAIAVMKLAELLEFSPSHYLKHAIASNKSAKHSELVPCIILRVGEERLGLLVDTLLDEQDIVLKPQSKLLKRIRNVSGATILGSGEVCIVLNPQDLVKSIWSHVNTTMRDQPLSTDDLPQSENRKQSILLVEDSIAIRTQEKRILEGAGYAVTTAVDGLDALGKLQANTFDAIVSDIQMPNLDGLSLATQVRQKPEYRELPIILVTSLASDEDKRRGAEAGANAYITKGSFDQTLLLETLKRLV